MAKHSVPKRKTSKSRTSRRYKAFSNQVQDRLLSQINLTSCPDCGQTRLSHHVCPHCGMYRGRQILDFAKKAEKITKIKA